MKNIVIFGACSAIAQATQKLWATDKAKLILVDRNKDQLSIVAQDLQTRGAIMAHTIAADLSQTENHHSLWKEIQKYMSPDVVLIAYGTLGSQQTSQRDVSHMQQELQTNFISVTSLLSIIANDFEEHPTPSKTIAVISSVAGDRGRQSNYVYGSAKGGLSIFLQGLRNRLAKKGIHVMTIKPGFVDTPMTAEFKKGFLWVKPEAIAKTIYTSIEKQKNVVYAPWFWRIIMGIIKVIPEFIFKKMSL